jgi:MinD-like ATPase involved in chromosome partitioning or flagellar assembly
VPVPARRSRPSDLSAEARAFAFISLLRDEADARVLAWRLESVAHRWAANPALFLVPVVRGLDFFASSASQPAVDRWWGRNVPPSAVPVYLLCHEDGLASWLRGLDGVFMVAANQSAAAAYSSWTVVDADPETASSALASAAIIQFAPPPEPAAPSPGDIFDCRDTRVVVKVHSDLAARPSRPDLPSLLRLDSAGNVPRKRAAVAAPDPFDLLADETARREPRFPSLKPASSERPSRSGASALSRVRPRLPLAGRRRSGVSDAALAAILISRAPTLVVVGSRKGGVGKTSHAAGIAIAAGGTLDSVGHQAAIVDANIANPDAWGQLNLPAHSATVRDLAAALSNGSEPPLPIHAATPALACYPERRDGVEYSRTDIRRLAAHLRARYAFVVVDMSNRLPDPTGGPEATVAAYWLEEADALILPTATSRQDFNGVLDYLDVSNLPPTVVPCIVSSARRNRRHPMTLQYLEAITARVHTVIQIPDEADSVRLAGMDGVPVQDVSPRMRLAYRELTEAAARLPARFRR